MKLALFPVITGIALLLTGAGIATADTDRCESSDEFASRIHLELLSNVLGDDDNGDEDGLLDLASVLRSTHEHTEQCED